MCEIEFHVVSSDLAGIPRPFPAGEQLPDWFKDMPADHDQHPTLKRCSPFLTAMGTGYIIPAPTDSRLTMLGSGVMSEHASVKFFSGHFPQQFQGAPFAGNTVIKFDNPWIIVTPPDYVCLITAPFNRFEMPFVPLTGIVETGTYYKQVKLPMVCWLQPGQSFDVRRGLPMVQVIPIRRETWTSRIAAIDHERNDEQQARFDANQHAYKDEFWKKLYYS